VLVPDILDWKLGIKIFNGLPLELKTIENFKVFKMKLKMI
jgi:hypothetical protein